MIAVSAEAWHSIILSRLGSICRGLAFYSTSYHALAVPAASESLTLWLCDSPPPLHLNESLRHCSDLEHPNRHILSTPIAILCIFVSKFIHESTLCHIWINVLIRTKRIQKNCCHIWWIHLLIHIWEYEEFVRKPFLVYMFFSWIHIQIHDFQWIHMNRQYKFTLYYPI